MKSTTLIFASFVLLGSATVAHAQVVLFNNLNATGTVGYYDTDGGQNDQLAHGGQVGQIFTDNGASGISKVESLYVGYSNSSLATAYLVQVFNFSAGVAGSMVGQQTVSTYNETDSLNSKINANQYDVSLSTNISGLTSANQYLLTMQVQGPNMTFLENDESGIHGTFARDFTSFGNAGAFGTTTWTDVSSLNLKAGNSLMKITGAQAVPSPQGWLALGLGICALKMRKHR